MSTARAEAALVVLEAEKAQLERRLKKVPRRKLEVVHGRQQWRSKFCSYVHHEKVDAPGASHYVSSSSQGVTLSSVTGRDLSERGRQSCSMTEATLQGAFPQSA